jgi:predicted nucleic acid-binding protein
MIVVDASAAVQVSASAEGFGSLVELQPVAPPLMWSEAISVLHESLWRGAVSVELARASRERLLVAPVERRAPEELLAEAWRVADQLGWAKTYDAEYIALAHLLDCRLLTIDERLRRSASRLVSIITLSDL